MGLILAKFYKKKKTSLELLEQLDRDIKAYANFRYTTELRQRTIVVRFLIISIALYVLMALIAYFYYHPNNINDRISFMVPLIGMPALILVLKRVVMWWYNRKIAINQSRLGVLRAEKKRMLEEVMETETYRVARAILDKYAQPPVEQPARKGAPGSLLLRNRFVLSNVSPSSLSHRLHRARLAAAAEAAAAATTVPPTPDPKQEKTESGILPPPRSAKLLQAAGLLPSPPPPSSLSPISNMIQQSGGILPPSNNAKEHQPHRSLIDRMVDFLVQHVGGDGPTSSSTSPASQQRCALICAHCAGHNGLALKDEFDYLSFNCCYCMRFNPARRIKKPEPVAGPPPLTILDFLQQHILPLDQQREQNIAVFSDNTISETKKKPDEDDDDVEVKTLYTNEPAAADFDKLSATDIDDAKLSDSDVVVAMEQEQQQQKKQQQKDDNQEQERIVDDKLCTIQNDD